MGITSGCWNIVSANMVGGSFLSHCAIGSGNLAFNAGQTVIENELERNSYSTADLTTAGQITFTTDWSTVEMSGLVIREHGMMTPGSGMANREVFTGSLVFTGEEEFQVQQTFKFFS